MRSLQVNDCARRSFRRRLDTITSNDIYDHIGMLFGELATVRRFLEQNGRERFPADPPYYALSFQNRDNEVVARVDDYDLIADQNVIVAAPFGVNFDHLGWQRIEVDAGRHRASDTH